MTKEHFHNFANLTEDGRFKDKFQFKEYRGEEIPSNVVIYQQFENGQEPEEGQLIGFTTNWPRAGVYWDGNGILITSKERRDNGKVSRQETPPDQL